MKKGGLFALLIVAALLVAVPGAVFAQGGTDPICTGLTDADCQLLNSTTAAMEGITSFSIPSFSVNFALNTVEGETTFNASGSGHVMVPEGLTEDMDLAEVEGLLLHLVLDSVAYSTPTDSNSGSGEIIVIDDMLYVLYGGEWYGGQLEEEDLAEGEELELDDELDAADVEDIAELQQMFDELGIDLSGVISTARGADTDAMGQAVANFTTTVDLTQLFVALLQSPAVGEAMGMAGEGEDAMTPEDMQMVAAMIAPMFQGTTISWSQGVGTEDNLLHSFALDIVLNADLSLFDPTIGAIAGTLNVSADLDEYNGTFDIEPPASFRPLEELEAKLEGVTEGLGM